MKILLIIFLTVATVVLLVLLTSFICFRLAFYAKKDKQSDEEFSLPPGKIYEPFRDTMLGWMREVRETSHEDVSIVSFDGLTLHGKYYEYSPDAPIELMFHGYRGRAERDLCGGVQRCFSLGRSALIVDQRACGKSDGNIISFGINERHDCLSWVNFIIKHYGDDSRIILTGISMGASTVMMAAGMDLPKNVIGILADCGYTSARDIIKKVIREMKLPADQIYPFVRLGAKIYGRFDPEETSPYQAMKHCRVPAIFIHGEADDFVPCEMSKANYEVCVAPKKLLTVPGAGHGLSFLVDGKSYLKTLSDFSYEKEIQLSAFD